MRRASMIVAVSLAMAGCAGARNQTGEAAGGSTPDPAAAERERQIQIYSAMVEEMLSTDDNSFGADPDFAVIYVHDVATDGAGDPIPDSTDPEATPGGIEPISEDVQRGVVDALPEYPLDFTHENVVIPVKEGGGVKDDGAVITLGTIPDGGARVEVGIRFYVGPLAATWMTYVVERRGSGWEVTGTTGPVAIS